MKKKILSICLATAAIAASALTLDSKCQVVIPENANVQEKYAATELAKYLGEVLGSELKQSSEDKFAGGQAIFLGNTKIAQAENLGNFANEEYAIHAKDGSVVISGGQFRGILYGSYDFLERFAGVRFFSPECERVPKQSSITVPDDCAIRRSPAFEFRQIYPSGGHKGWSQEFKAKQRCNANNDKLELGGSDIHGKGGFCHTYYLYSKDLPKELSWMNADGERVVVTTPHKGSICFSQPEVVKHFAKRLKEFIKEDRITYAEKGLPAPRFYAVQQNDSSATCYCPECIAFKKQHGLSGLVVDFTNKIADSIKDEYPDIYILIFAYIDSVEPPLTDIRPRSNVLPQITTYTQPHQEYLRAIDDPRNVKASELLDKWSSISDNIAIWDYWRHFGGFLPPIPPVKIIKGRLLKYRKCRTKLFFTEFELDNKHILSFFDLTCYVGYRLLDNPDQDTDALIDDFMDGYYGAAAPFMRKYLDILTEKYTQLDANFVGEYDLYSNGLDLLTQAEKAVGNSDEGKLIAKRIHIETMLLWATYKKEYLKEHSDKPLTIDGAAVTEKDVSKIIEDMIPDVSDVLLSDREKTEAKRKEMIKFFAHTALKATQHPAPKALDAIPEDAKVYACDELKSIAAKTDDDDAPQKAAYSLAAKWARDRKSEENEKKHYGAFNFGMYEQSEAHFVSETTFSAKDVPQDEQYHWYYVGRTQLKPKLLVHVHWTWEIDSQLGKFYDAKNPDQEYEIYLRIKLQGPAYVKGSTKPNDVRIAETALRKINN